MLRTIIYYSLGLARWELPDDPMAVVDSQAKVFGVQRLWVVDASAFPLLLGAIHKRQFVSLLRYLFASAYALGEAI